MKLFLTLLLATTLAATSAYGLDEETKDKLISLYNYTRNNYIFVDGLIDDFKAEKIDATRAEEKIGEWKATYSKATEAVPDAADKMRESMLAIFDIAKELVHDYRPQNLTTKNLLDELDEARDALMDELTAIKYMVQ